MISTSEACSDIVSYVQKGAVTNNAAGRWLICVAEVQVFNKSQGVLFDYRVVRDDVFTRSGSSVVCMKGESV